MSRQDNPVSVTEIVTEIVRDRLAIARIEKTDWTIEEQIGIIVDVLKEIASQSVDGQDSVALAVQQGLLTTK